MGRTNKYLIFLGLAVIGLNCRKPYVPPATRSGANYLVVEGTINTAPNSVTTIHLSRTVNLKGVTSQSPELGAAVTIESAENIPYFLGDQNNGDYAAYLNMDPSSKYRLRIKTANGKEYLSDFTQPKTSPPIDSVNFELQKDGIQLYVNTHDPKNSTRYYRWDYEEDWEFHAKYESAYITDGHAIVPRSTDQINYYCYTGDKSSTIVLGSSAKLSQDIISQNPVTKIASTSEKIEVRYSILVRQHALTQDAYNFWQQLKKNTEQLGSIFDAQPSEISGNIHNIKDPSEVVVGYISSGTIEEKRIFISNQILPRTIEWQPAYPYDCTLDSMLYCHHTACINDVANSLIPLGSPEIPAIPLYAGGNIYGYLSSSVECTDCTIRGTKQPPPFWDQ